MCAKKTGLFGRRRFLEVTGGSIALSSWPLKPSPALERRTKKRVSCSVYPAAPNRLSRLKSTGCSVREEPGVVTLSNSYLGVEISKKTGLVVGLVNKLVNSVCLIKDDETGFRINRPGNQPYERWATEGPEQSLRVEIAQSSESATVVMSSRFEGIEVGFEYSIRDDHFWIERSLFIKGESELGVLDKVVYGRVRVSGSKSRVLQLGRFDRPRLVEFGSDGGVFAGVAWWFYQVDEEGIYQNQDMNYRCGREFRSEAWYLGVFVQEEDEPYPGWLWYKTFLEQRKREYDLQTSWAYWNAGWGQWGIDVDSASVPLYLELIHKLGVRGVAFGSGVSGKGIRSYVSLVTADRGSRENLGLLGDYQLAGGVLDQGGLKDRWAENEVVSAKLELLREYAELGFRALYLDFFETVDTYVAHRHVSEYLETARGLLDYTECHLGMAAYGPQFQRQVLLNHPTDLHGFDISHFSSDWATFLGFRQSRREWQQRYDYLMPEYSLYYFVTHYSNWGHPKRYTDPEPQQLLYGPHSYCGLAYNFHDLIGFRNTLVAASAFTTYFVFGHLELKMPREDVEFTASILRWVSENADLLSYGRVCLESQDVCVISKIKDGKGVIFILNYGAEECCFSLQIFTESRDPVRVREVYPLRKPGFELEEGGEIEVELAGEQVVILEVNQGLRSLPQENRGSFREEIKGWVTHSSELTKTFFLPDLRSLGTEMSRLDLPVWLESLDQVGAHPVTSSAVGKGQDLETMGVLGRGPLPKAFLELYDFRQGRFVETWKLVPWAFPNRIWFVLTPENPISIKGPFPELAVNGRKVTLFPRVDYRPERLELWNCPVLLADITPACNYGAKNKVSVRGVDGSPVCYVAGPVLRA